MLQGAPPPPPHICSKCADESGARRMFVFMVEGDAEAVAAAVRATGATITVDPFPADWRAEMLVRATQAALLPSAPGTGCELHPPRPEEAEPLASG